MILKNLCYFAKLWYSVDVVMKYKYDKATVCVPLKSLNVLLFYYLIQFSNDIMLYA